MKIQFMGTRFLTDVLSIVLAGAGFSAGGSEALALPDDYAPIEYIESTGTQYLDTGYTPKDLNMGFYVDFVFNNTVGTTDSATLMGSSKYNNGQWGGLIVGSYTSKARGQLTFGSGFYDPGLVKGTRIQAELKNKKYTTASAQDDTYQGESYTVNATSMDKFINASVYLCARNVDDKTRSLSMSRAKVYRLKFYDGETVVHDFVPVLRKQDSEVGLFDVVGDKGFRKSATEVPFCPPPSFVIVTGTSEIGTPSPDYGVIPGLAAGDALVFTAPSEVSDEDLSATCLGWKLYRYDYERFDWCLSEESDSASRTRCAYTHGTAPARLVWQWDSRVAISAATAGTGSGSVSVSTNYAACGSLVTCTATPDAHSVFDHWEGDVPAGSERCPTVSLDVGVESIVVTGVFAAVEGTAEDLVYVGEKNGAWEDPANWNMEKVPTALDNVTIDGRSVVCAGVLEARSVTITGNGASLKVGDGVTNLSVSVGGDFLILNGAQATFWAGRTAGVDPTDWIVSASVLYAQANAHAVRIGGLLKVGSGSTLYAQNDKLTGTPVFFKPRNFEVMAGGAVDAVGRGCDRFARANWSEGGAPVGATFGFNNYSDHDADHYSYAFGRGDSYSFGAGHGAAASNGSFEWTVNQVADATYGQTNRVSQMFSISYGYSTAPYLSGSPQGSYNTSQQKRVGGGSVCVFATEKATVNGTLRADADGWNAGGGYGGASGGSIWLAAKVLAVGRSAELTARGGDSSYNSVGGGGRIALTAGASQGEIDSFATGGTPAGFTVTDISEVTANVNGGNNNAYGNAGTSTFIYAGGRVLPTVVTAEGEESGEVTPAYGFNVFDRGNLPTFSCASGSGAAYDPAYRNRRRTSMTKLVLFDKTGEVDTLVDAIAPATAVWMGKIEASLRVKVIGGGMVTVNGEPYAADVEIWLPESDPVVLTAVDGTGRFVRFAGDVPGGMSKARTCPAPVRPGMIVQAVFDDAVAVEKSFVGADGSFWDDDESWSPEGIPTAVDRVTVGGRVKCYNVLAAGTLSVTGGQLLIGGLADVDWYRTASTAPDEYVCGIGIAVEGDVSVGGAAEIVLGARLGAVEPSDANIGGSLSLSDSSKMTVHARSYPADAEMDASGRPVVTNFYRTAYAVKVSGSLTLSGTSQIFPDCDNLTGNPVRFDVGGDVRIGEGTTVNARTSGFGWVNGSTKSTTHGSSWDVGGTYAGLAYAPYTPGAPSGNYFGRSTRGGGTIWIKTSRRIILDGVLDASGACPNEDSQSGSASGSSGGGIWLVCAKLVAGKNALAKAYGGFSSSVNAKGGGGGSICVAQKVADGKLARLAEGQSAKGCVFVDEIEAFETDVSGHLNPGKTSSPGPKGTAAVVRGSLAFRMSVR